MRRKSRSFFGACAFGALVAAGVSSARASVVFNDTFTGSSSVDQTNFTPTANSTNYDVAASKSATNSSISSGNLHLTLNSTTSSGFGELQALFSSSPSQFALVNTGDTIEYDVTFKDTNGGLLLTSSSNIMMGLFNSGSPQSAPYPSGDLANSGLSTTTGSTFATGGTADWVGYVGQFVQSGQNNELLVRPAQNGSGTTSANQELMGNNFGGGAFDNPNQTSVTKAASSISLTSNDVYTADMLITDLGGGQISVGETLYSGSSPVAANSLGGVTITTTAAAVTSFDGLGFGMRTTTNTATLTADISDISVTYTPAASVPEPATIAMIGLTGLGLMHRRRRV